nr:trypsin eta [Drosophila takahashii]
MLSAGQKTDNISQQISTLSATTKAMINSKPKINDLPRYPYVVSIGTNVKGSYKHLCVGVILSNQFVLTAAHCVKPSQALNSKTKMFVAAGDDFVGSRKQTRFFVVRLEWHPQFKPLGGYDIALMKVHPKLPLDGTRFRSINFNDRPQKASGVKVSMVGWGRVSIGRMKKLKELPFETIDNGVCKQKHRFVFLTKVEMCAVHLKGSIGACDGDSGAPLIDVAKGKLYGLLSYGKKACKPLKPYAFTRVSEYSKWIRRTMDKMALN